MILRSFGKGAFPSPMERPAHHRILRFAFVTTLVLYAISLSQDCCFVGRENPESVPAVAIVFFGIYSGAVAWFANPALIAGCVLSVPQQSRIAGLVLLIIALGLALSFQLQIGDEIKTHRGGGVLQQVVGVGPGYWIWISSILVSCAGGATAWAMTFDEKTDRVPNGDD